MGTPRITAVGRYELLLELAKGGMAELYLGRLHGVAGFAKLVAIKRILPHLAEDKLFVEMFLNEGRIAAQLAHPNVCQVYELGEDDGDLFLAMEYLEGVSWDALLRAHDGRDPARSLRLAAGVIGQACEGLHYAHELRDVDGTPTPVIHRDVSPQNLFVTIGGSCKVLDFGVSKMVKDGPRTRTGVIKGKLPYMSPEQIQGDPIDARSDVFALGVVLWEALARTALFDRDTDFQIWKAVTEAPIPPLAPRGFPAEIDAVIGAALARDRERRFRSARALGEALRHAAEQVGGALDPAELGRELEACCGAAIAERQREVASVVTQRRSRPRLDEPTAADTIEDAPGSTVSLRPEQPGSTVSLRAEPVKVRRPDADEPAADDPAPARRARWPFVLAAVSAAAGIVIGVVVATRDGDDAPARAASAGTEVVAPPAVPPAPTPPAPTEAAGQPASVAAKLDKAFDALDRVQRLDETIRDRKGTRRSTTARETPAPPAPSSSAGQRPRSSEVVRSALRTAGVGKDVEALVESAIASDPELAEFRAKPPATEPGLLSIDSSPYATIYVSGKKLGDTPLFRVPVAPGKHAVRAVRADGREQTFTIEVRAGAEVTPGKLAW